MADGMRSRRGGQSPHMVGSDTSATSFATNDDIIDDILKSVNRVINDMSSITSINRRADFQIGTRNDCSMNMATREVFIPIVTVNSMLSVKEIISSIEDGHRFGVDMSVDMGEKGAMLSLVITLPEATVQMQRAVLATLKSPSALQTHPRVRRKRSCLRIFVFYTFIICLVVGIYQLFKWNVYRDNTM